MKEKTLSQEEIPSRRTVLRGAFALGCGLWIPVVFSGCDSKQGTPSGSAAPTGSPASTPASSAKDTAPPAAGKASQASVQYQAQPKDEQKCGQCQHFIAGSNTCMLVDGSISPEGWCKLFAKKT